MIAFVIMMWVLPITIIAVGAVVAFCGIYGGAK